MCDCYVSWYCMALLGILVSLVHVVDMWMAHTDIQRS